MSRYLLHTFTFYNPKPSSGCILHLNYTLVIWICPVNRPEHSHWVCIHRCVISWTRTVVYWRGYSEVCGSWCRTVYRLLLSLIGIILFLTIFNEGAYLTVKSVSIRPSIYFSSIVKSRSNPFPEPTSTKQ